MDQLRWFRIDSNQMWLRQTGKICWCTCEMENWQRISNEWSSRMREGDLILSSPPLIIIPTDNNKDSRTVGKDLIVLVERRSCHTRNKIPIFVRRENEYDGVRTAESPLSSHNYALHLPRRSAGCHRSWNKLLDDQQCLFECSIGFHLHHRLECKCFSLNISDRFLLHL